MLALCQELTLPATGMTIFPTKATPSKEQKQALN